MHGITGTRYKTQHRRSPRLGDGGLTSGEREASGRVLGHHRPLKCRQEGPVWLNADEKLGAPDTRNGKGSLHLQAAGSTAEEMCGSPEQIDHSSPFFLHGLEGDCCVGIEAENRLVEQGEVCPASVLHPNLITGAERVIECHRLPLRCTYPL